MATKNPNQRHRRAASAWPVCVRDTLAWFKTQDPGGRSKLAGPSPQKEAELLAAWKGSRG